MTVQLGSLDLKRQNQNLGAIQQDNNFPNQSQTNDNNQNEQSSPSSLTQQAIQKDFLGVQEATLLINEAAFERLDSHLICFALTQIVKHIRLKTKSKEVIIQKMLGQEGLNKIYRLFTQSKVPDVRKLAGRLLCEATFKCVTNQDFFCQIFDFEPTFGRVTINLTIPALIKKKLQEDSDFLLSLQHAEEFSKQKQSSKVRKRYWSFPEFREISTAVLHSQHYQQTRVAPNSGAHQRLKSSMGNGNDIDRSLTPQKTKENRILGESMQEYLNFPDPQLYLIGFQCQETRQSGESILLTNTSQTIGDEIGQTVSGRMTKSSHYAPPLATSFTTTPQHQNQKNHNAEQLGKSAQVNNVLTQFQSQQDQKRIQKNMVNHDLNQNQNEDLNGVDFQKVEETEDLGSSNLYNFDQNNNTTHQQLSYSQVVINDDDRHAAEGKQNMRESQLKNPDKLETQVFNGTNFAPQNAQTTAQQQNPAQVFSQQDYLTGNKWHQQAGTSQQPHFFGQILPQNQQKQQKSNHLVVQSRKRTDVGGSQHSRQTSSSQGSSVTPHRPHFGQQTTQLQSSTLQQKIHQNQLQNNQQLNKVGGMRIPSVSRRSTKGKRSNFSGTTGGYPTYHHYVKTTESTESQGRRTDSEMSENQTTRHHYHYMRHTSSSEQRAKSRQFGKSASNLVGQSSSKDTCNNVVGVNPNSNPTHQQVQQSSGLVQQQTSAQTNWAQLRNYKNIVTVLNSGETSHQSASANSNQKNGSARGIPPKTNKYISQMKQRPVTEMDRRQSEEDSCGIIQSQPKNNDANKFGFTEPNRRCTPPTSQTILRDETQISAPKTERPNHVQAFTLASEEKKFSSQSTKKQQEVVVSASADLKKPDEQISQGEIKHIIKRLHKPEMLLLNHLQNQIKYYYPSKMNKYLSIDKGQTDVHNLNQRQALQSTMYQKQELMQAGNNDLGILMAGRPRTEIGRELENPFQRSSTQNEAQISGYRQNEIISPFMMQAAHRQNTTNKIQDINDSKRRSHQTSSVGGLHDTFEKQRLHLSNSFMQSAQADPKVLNYNQKSVRTDNYRQGASNQSSQGQKRIQKIGQTSLKRREILNKSYTGGTRPHNKLISPNTTLDQSLNLKIVRTTANGMTSKVATTSTERKIHKNEPQSQLNLTFQSLQQNKKQNRSLQQVGLGLTTQRSTSRQNYARKGATSKENRLQDGEESNLNSTTAYRKQQTNNNSLSRKRQEESNLRLHSGQRSSFNANAASTNDNLQNNNNVQSNLVGYSSANMKNIVQNSGKKQVAMTTRAGGSTGAGLINSKNSNQKLQGRGSLKQKNGKVADKDLSAFKSSSGQRQNSSHIYQNALDQSQNNVAGQQNFQTRQPVGVGGTRSGGSKNYQLTKNSQVTAASFGKQNVTVKAGKQQTNVTSIRGVISGVVSGLQSGQNTTNSTTTGGAGIEQIIDQNSGNNKTRYLGSGKLSNLSSSKNEIKDGGSLVNNKTTPNNVVVSVKNQPSAYIQVLERMKGKLIQKHKHASKKQNSQIPAINPDQSFLPADTLLQTTDFSQTQPQTFIRKQVQIASEIDTNQIGENSNYVPLETATVDFGDNSQGQNNVFLNHTEDKNRHLFSPFVQSSTNKAHETQQAFTEVSLEKSKPNMIGQMISDVQEGPQLITNPNLFVIEQHLGQKGNFGIDSQEFVQLQDQNSQNQFKFVKNGGQIGQTNEQINQQEANKRGYGVQQQENYQLQEAYYDMAQNQ